MSGPLHPGQINGLPALMQAVNLLKKESKRLQEAREKDRFRFIVTQVMAFLGPIIAIIVGAWAGAYYGAQTAKADLQPGIDQTEMALAMVRDITADLHSRAEWSDKDRSRLAGLVLSLQSDRDWIVAELDDRAYVPATGDPGFEVTGSYSTWPDFRALDKDPPKLFPAPE